MDEHKNILDAPSESEGTFNAGIAPSIATKIDYGINVFLLAVAAVGVILTLFDQGSGLFLLLVGNLVIGGYQLLSALIGGIRGNRKKLYYLAAAITYLLLLYTWVELFNPSIIEQSGLASAVIFLIVLPLGGAVYYTFLCHEAKNRS